MLSLSQHAARRETTPNSLRAAHCIGHLRYRSRSHKAHETTQAWLFHSSARQHSNDTKASAAAVACQLSTSARPDERWRCADDLVRHGTGLSVPTMDAHAPKCPRLGAQKAPPIQSPRRLPPPSRGGRRIGPPHSRCVPAERARQCRRQTVGHLQGCGCHRCQTLCFVRAGGRFVSEHNQSSLVSPMNATSQSVRGGRQFGRRAVGHAAGRHQRHSVRIREREANHQPGKRRPTLRVRDAVQSVQHGRAHSICTHAHRSAGARQCTIVKPSLGCRAAPCGLGGLWDNEGGRALFFLAWRV